MIFVYYMINYEAILSFIQTISILKNWQVAGDRAGKNKKNI